jgi:hypothetical protein
MKTIKKKRSKIASCHKIINSKKEEEEEKEKKQFTLYCTV